MSNSKQPKNRFTEIYIDRIENKKRFFFANPLRYWTKDWTAYSYTLLLRHYINICVALLLHFPLTLARSVLFFFSTQPHLVPRPFLFADTSIFYLVAVYMYELKDFDESDIPTTQKENHTKNV